MLFTHHLADTQEVAQYLGGDFPPRRAHHMDLHLSRCPECRDAVADFRRRAKRRESYAAASVAARNGSGPEAAWAASALTDTGGITMVGTRRRRMVSNAVPTVGAILTVLAFVSVLVAAWNAGGSHARADLDHSSESFSDSGTALSDYDIADLRRAGWTCPDLRPNGLTMTSSTGTRQGDIASVTITYSGPSGAVVLTETRSTAAGVTSAPTGTSGDEALRFTVANGLFALHSGMDEKANAALRDSVVSSAKESDQDAQAAAASGWERLSRGFARLVDPTR